MAVGEPVAREEDPPPRVEAPDRRDVVADDRVDEEELGTTEIEPVAHLEDPEAILVLGKDEVEIPHVAADREGGIAGQPAADPGGMWGLLVGREDVAHCWDAACEETFELRLDHRQVLRMTCLDEQGALVAGDEIGGVVAVDRLAFVGLHEAATEPEDARNQLSRERVWELHALALPSTRGLPERPIEGRSARTRRASSSSS